MPFSSRIKPARLTRPAFCTDLRWLDDHRPAPLRLVRATLGHWGQRATETEQDSSKPATGLSFAFLCRIYLPPHKRRRRRGPQARSTFHGARLGCRLFRRAPGSRSPVQGAATNNGNRHGTSADPGDLTAPRPGAWIARQPAPCSRLSSGTWSWTIRHHQGRGHNADWGGTSLAARPAPSTPGSQCRPWPGRTSSWTPARPFTCLHHRLFTSGEKGVFSLHFWRTVHSPALAASSGRLRGRAHVLAGSKH